MEKSLLKTIVLGFALSFSVVSVGFAAGGSIGYGDMAVYKDNALTSKISGQNPIEDGSMLVCDGKCMIKSEGISLVASDNSQIAVTNESDVFKLYVKKGKVDFIINNNVRKIAFYTPQGTYTVAEVVFNASSQAAVKGNVVVDKNGATEISVTEGKLVFATAEGVKAVDANNKLVLAVAPAAGAGGTGLSTGAIVGISAGAALALGGVIYAIDQNNDDNNDTPAVAATPPATPPTRRPTPPASPSS